jgi:ketosteroid isomerase-like protein
VTEPAPAAVEGYFDALNAHDRDALGALFVDPAAAEAPLAAAGSWAGYDEQPTRVVVSGDVVSVQAHFRGTTASGMLVELDAMTVFEVADGRIRRVDTWHEAPETDEHLELPAVRVMLEYFRAQNQEDWAGFDHVWTEDAVMDAVGGPRREGRASVTRAFQRFLGLFPQHNDTIQRLLITGNALAAEVHFDATSPQDKPFELEAVDVVDLTEDGSRIVRMSHWHDRDAFRKALGE